MASLAQRFIGSGFGFWIVLAIIGGYLLNPIRQKLKFGIDLVGGTYITLRVQSDKAIEAELRDKFREIDSTLKDSDGSPEVKNYEIKDNKLIISFGSSQDAQNAKDIALESLKDEGLIHFVSGSDIEVSYNIKKINYLKKWALESDIDVLRTRLNSLGVEDIKVTPQGESDIVVELPDVSDFEKAKQIIGKPAHLEFRVVEEVANSKDEILDKFSGDIPVGYEIMTWNDRGSKKYLLVEDYAEVSGKHLKSANPGVSTDVGMPSPSVSFTLTSVGGKKFYELTQDNIGKPLAIVLDGKVVSAPIINQAISDGSGRITGSFTVDETKELSTMLKSGTFVAPVTFEEERSIGPALGAESIKKGVLSCLVGLGLLFLFSVFVYKLSGFFAFLALIYNLFLLLFCMYLVRATLTLPGIAGMVLTIGMAIDSSILIYERIKELLKNGETVSASINRGFSGAMGVILDANITTFIVGAVLFYFGTGPVKGFAVTLMIGIICTLISGLFFLKSTFRAFSIKSGVQKLSI